MCLVGEVLLLVAQPQRPPDLFGALKDIYIYYYISIIIILILLLLFLFKNIFLLQKRHIATEVLQLLLPLRQSTTTSVSCFHAAMLEKLSFRALTLQKEGKQAKTSENTSQ